MGVLNIHEYIFDTAPKRVAPGLYQGAMGWDDTVEAAQSGKFNLVVLCAHDVELPSLPPGVVGVHLKLKDAPMIPEDAWPAIWRTVGMVREAVLNGQRVLVACAMGLNRSGLITGLTLRSLWMTGSEAVTLIRRARGPFALRNGYFRSVVESWNPSDGEIAL